MSKKISWDKLPEAVAQILEIVSSEESEHVFLPEIHQRISALEKKFDYLVAALSPDRPVMDLPTVCRILKIRPKAAHELAASGTLPSRTEGRKVLFYEDGVMKYFMTQPTWTSAVAMASARKAVATHPVAAEQKSAPVVTTGGDRSIDIEAASEMLGRTVLTIYKLTSTRAIPFHKEGRKLYFSVGELQQWLADNPPRKRRMNALH